MFRAPQIPNNDSFIDVSARSPKSEADPTTPHRVKKSVRIDEAPPEFYARSPSQGSAASQQFTENGSTARLPPTQMSTISEESINQLNQAPVNPSSRAPIHKHMIETRLTPRQYLFLAMGKIFNAGFILLHLILHAVILAILCYTVTFTDAEGARRPVDGFTVFLFFTTLFQLGTVFAGVMTHTGTELVLQIYSVVTGVATISALVSTMMWCFLFERLVDSMKVTAEAGMPVDTGTTIVSFYDILSQFYTVLVVVQFLDLAGLFTSLACTWYRLKHLYDLLPTEKMTFSSVIHSSSSKNSKAKSEPDDNCVELSIVPQRASASTQTDSRNRGQDGTNSDSNSTPGVNSFHHGTFNHAIVGST